MGMAASQARYLALTARKSNVEYQGQQVNQQRTLLATEQSELFSDLMALKNPAPPSVTDYTYNVYTFDASKEDGSTGSYRVKTNTIKTDASTELSTMIAEWTDPNDESEITGRFTSGTGTIYSALSVINPGTTGIKAEETSPQDVTNLKNGSWEDEKGYNEALAKYNADLAIYNKEVQKINAKTEQIQIQDRTLELKLRNLDTEQNAIQTELESVKKVIESTIETVFKTFQS